jgi:hypothetical protein
MARDEVTLREDGRWGGKLTRRPLPDVDSEIDALSAADRAAMVEVWHGRSASERRVADSFAVIRDALVGLAADPKLTALAARAIDDEFRHAELSRLVASRYAGRDLPAPELLPLVYPKHEEAPVRLRHLLHVVGQCCLNETIASAFLEAALSLAKTPLATAALRELLSDEVDHARLGWALLASVDERTRADVIPWLPSMAIANLRMWREAPRKYPDNPELAAHGAPPLDAVERALLTAFRELIIPGFEQLGMAVPELRAWLDRGAPT